jgi:pimeloyl-ACP methyl ester carboxylesterase
MRERQRERHRLEVLYALGRRIVSGWPCPTHPGAGTVAFVQTDVLGAPYEQQTIDLGRDDEGPVTATLVRRRAERPTSAAVLYIHGFVDYFFQTHLADFWCGHGYDFYAVDLRKYGRSLQPHQTPNFCQSLDEYYPSSTRPCGSSPRRTGTTGSSSTVTRPAV